jgi:hypothetical protein
MVRNPQAATGSLSLAPGHEGRGAVLSYRFTCLDQTHCGYYVAAIWKAPSPLKPAAALSLWVRPTPEVELVIRVIDQSGQTVQFQANVPTLEHKEFDEWQQVVVSIRGKPVHTGSARIAGRLRDTSLRSGFWQTHVIVNRHNGRSRSTMCACFLRRTRASVLIKQQP